MPHPGKKHPHVPALGGDHFRSKGQFTYDLSEPRLKSAITSLPDDQRLLAIENFERKPLAPGSEEILQQLKRYKSVFPNEVRAKLQQLRTREASRGALLAASTLPRVAPAVPVRGLAGTDDNDPTRLTVSVKTPTGTFNDASGCPIMPPLSACAVINLSALPTQVLALSQGLINASFGYLWKLTPALQTINITNQFGSLAANLKAPQVSLTVVQPGPPLWYMCVALLLSACLQLDGY